MSAARLCRCMGRVEIGRGARRILRTESSNLMFLNDFRPNKLAGSDPPARFRRDDEERLMQSSDARIDFDAWRRRIREDVQANYHLAMGSALLERGELEAARPAFERALGVDPSCCAAWAGLMDAFLAAGREADGAAVAARACARDPHAIAKGRARRAVEAFLAQRFDAARSEAEKTAGDEHAESRSARALMALHDADYRGALSLLEGLCAVPFAETLLPLMTRGSVRLLAAGDQAGSEALARRGREVWLAGGRAVISDLNILFSVLGQALATRGALEEAAAVLDEGTAEFPDKAILWFDAGRYRLCLGALDLAEAAFLRQIGAGGVQLGKFGLGLVRLARKEPRDALALFTEARERGEARERARERGEAEDAAAAACFAVSGAALARLELGEAAAASTMLDAALSAENRPTLAAWLKSNKALAAHALGRLEEAKALQREAAALAPAWWKFHVGLRPSFAEAFKTIGALA